MISLGLKPLTRREIVEVARNGVQVELSAAARERICKSRAVVDKYVKESIVAYGITTGVGKLCNTFVTPEQAAQLQVNLSLSHSCGVGKRLSEEESRAVMVIRVNNFARGCSGISLPIVEKMVEMLNLGLNPVLPEGGGVGSSGSLSTGGHMALAITGRGEICYRQEVLLAAEAFARAGIQPAVLETKDCLSLINGTHAMCGIGILAMEDLWKAIKVSEICTAVSLEALAGNTAAFDQRLNGSKLHKGQTDAAANIIAMLEGSEIFTMKHRNVQDAYSYRCVPQVNGGAREVLEFAEGVLKREINSVSDNPVVIAEDEVILSGGNFHGQIPGLALDNVAMAVATVSKIVERRISRLIDPQSSGLPAFLIENSGLNSGLMIPQYIAASLASEIKLLANPASTDSIPTSGGQEDVVSNGTLAAIKAREAVNRLQSMLGVEIICAAQALDLSRRVNLGKGTIAAQGCIRRHVSKLEEDRFLEPDIVEATGLVASGELVEAVEKAIGTLK